MPQELLVLIDGSSYLYRAFHALPPLTNSKGQPTGAVYGVLNMIKKLLADYQPQYVAVVFDAPGKTFRHEAYAEYKAHRPSMPEELRSQIQPLHEVIQAMHLPLIVLPGVEADDVIATLALKAKQAGMATLISTGDKDLAQLVDQDITLINTMSNTVLDAAGVLEKFGVTPAQIVDYLTLVGDSSDNIPGIESVGPKTAAKWLSEYGNLETVLANAHQFSEKIQAKIEAAKPKLAFFKKLLTVHSDVELPCHIQELAPGQPNAEKLMALFKDLEFKSWLTELLNQAEKKQAHYETILTETQLEAWIQKLQKARYYGFDTETTDLNYMKAEIVGLSFAVSSGEACYLPLAHREMTPQLSRESTLAKLKPLLEDHRPQKIGHHLKYDREVLLNHGIELNGIAFDTLLESFVFDATANRHDLETLALKYLGHQAISFEEVAGKGANQLTFDLVDIESATQYAAEDADLTLQLHQQLWPKIDSHPGLKFVFETIELPLIPVLAQMERTGVLIDADLLKAQSSELGRRLAVLEEQAFVLAGQSFNLNSPKQLQEILFTHLKLPMNKKTPTGQASTSEAVLQELADEFELPRIILEYRSFAKLKSTYTDRLPLQIFAKTGRVHTSYHQAGAGTGRLSSSDPNLQNIPVRTEEGRKIRQAFIAPPGYQLISADYSQIELRIMAHMSQDRGLLDAFAHGLDIHKATASEIFGIPLDQVDAEHRRRAKAINFGLIYGMSAFGLAKQIGVERAVAQVYMDAYFERYPGVRRYMEETRAKAHQSGWVETLFGRRLHLPEINSPNAMRRMGSERAAINAPMQGTAADIIKRAMITVYNDLAEGDWDAKMIMQVHDELVLEVVDHHVADIKERLPLWMGQAADLDVPLLVSVGSGSNWDEAH